MNENLFLSRTLKEPPFLFLKNLTFIIHTVHCNPMDHSVYFPIPDSFYSPSFQIISLPPFFLLSSFMLSVPAARPSWLQRSCIIQVIVFCYISLCPLLPQSLHCSSLMLSRPWNVTWANHSTVTDSKAFSQLWVPALTTAHWPKRLLRGVPAQGHG